MKLNNKKIKCRTSGFFCILHLPQQWNSKRRDKGPRWQNLIHDFMSFAGRPVSKARQIFLVLQCLLLPSPPKPAPAHLQPWVLHQPGDGNTSTHQKDDALLFFIHQQLLLCTGLKCLYFCAKMWMTQKQFHLLKNCTYSLWIKIKLHVPLKAEVKPFSYELPEKMHHFIIEKIVPPTCKIVLPCQLDHAISIYKVPPMKMN